MALVSRKTLNFGMLALAVVVALAFLFYAETGSRTPLSDQTQPLVQQADFFLLNSQSYQYDAAGKLDITIHSEKLQHNPVDNSVSMQKPRFDLYRDGVYNWTLTSQQGLISEKGDEVDLQREVAIVSSDTITTLNTDQLFIYPDKRQAKTDRPVALHSSNGLTTAIGLEADLDNKTLGLLQRVRGQYEPDVLQRR